ncbi:hypothetical protein SAMD00019534_046510 [Acytostelium subglobosum LB1]|uniref:hypothetical protein n=1 Tax=Acytostelium subglobosum LB1 TaxID=1410327 RepID=UPI000644DA61|nr:hypothetical protein SAMD00019534_046510 [Acytostelium subglobosum LB1]GAM21476.1 hypothetical protein SAMD00019534_046510 [Acytostelium subglobosum LB1]|eukprot:XP_012755595.1 hypothetical protein SAMD00019534_046510 [Acytostelium subglobosum LB1]
MVACGLQLQTLELDLEDIGDVSYYFGPELLDYLKSTKTLNTFRYNQQLSPETLLFLFQSPESTIRNLSLVQRPTYHYDYPTVSNHLHKLSIKLFEIDAQDEQFSDEFLKSLSNVDHIKTNMLNKCALIVDNNRGSISISLPFGSIVDDAFGDLIDQLMSNTTISFIYNIVSETHIHGNAQSWTDYDHKLMCIQKVVDKHPSIINKSTWHWQLLLS